MQVNKRILNWIEAYKKQFTQGELINVEIKQNDQITSVILTFCDGAKSQYDFTKAGKAL